MFNRLFLTICFLFASHQAIAGTWQPKISGETLSAADGIAFSKKFQFDFNNDGVEDIVDCRTSHFLKIRNGANRNQLLYSWTGPAKTRGRNKLILSGCEIIRIDNQTPVVFLHSFWATPVWRANAYQHYVFHNGKKWVTKRLHVEGFGNYRTVSRNFDCHRYPWKLVKLGYKPGLLCFNSDYAQDYHNRSALFKIEMARDRSRLIAHDISGSSGLFWKNGARATSIWDFPVGSGFANNQRDGAFMMDSTFLDYNRDGFVDLVTVGQHASVRSHRMILDRSKPQGIRFTNDVILRAARGQWTEYLTARAFNHTDKRVDIPCVYFSGEGHEGTPDHVRCFTSGSWKIVNLPFRFSSQYGGALIMPGGNGRVYIKTSRRDSRNRLQKDLLFKMPYFRFTKARTWLHRKKESVDVRGFMCKQNRTIALEAEVFSDMLYSKRKVLYNKVRTNQESTDWALNVCMQPNDVKKNYTLDLDRRKLLGRNGQKHAFYVYAKVPDTGERKLASVFTYDKVNGRAQNFKKLPMHGNESIEVKWNNKGPRYLYSLDIINAEGKAMAPCHDARELQKKTVKKLSGRCAHGRGGFAKNPHSKIRICAGPNGWFGPQHVVCSKYEPLYGPKMFIKIP